MKIIKNKKENNLVKKASFARRVGFIVSKLIFLLYLLPITKKSHNKLFKQFKGDFGLAS
jgi:hypothetical protein